jgi:hypothetical protein
MMPKALLTFGASILLVAGGSLASSAAETSASAAHPKRITRHHVAHQNVAHPGRDITSFSSSSVLHIGVNHPPKNR